GLAHRRDGRPKGRRGRRGQYVQPVRPDLAVRWLQGVGLRARGRHARPPRLRPAGGPLMATRGGAPKPASAGRNGTGRAVAARAQTAAASGTPARLEVRKTYKLYIGGAFPRTESGRSYLVSDADGAPLANACRASRKDLRAAGRAARKALDG